MTLAQSRLWLGISAVSVFVLTSAGLLYLEFPARLDRLELSNPTLPAGWVTAGILVFSPFDAIGGHLRPRNSSSNHRHSETSPGGWLCGAVIHGTATYLSLLLTLLAGQADGPVAATLTVLGLQLLLLPLQKQPARVTGRLALKRLNPDANNIQALPPVYLAADHDRGFTDSVVGWPGFEEVIIPAFWQSDLTAGELQVQIIHRTAAIRSGSRTRGLFLAIAVNTLSFTFCACLPMAGVSPVGALITTTLYLTIVSLMWLMVLSRWSRQGVFEADRYALDHGLEFIRIKTAAERISVRLQNDQCNYSGPEIRSKHERNQSRPLLARLCQTRTEHCKSGQRMAIQSLQARCSRRELTASAIGHPAVEPCLKTFPCLLC